MKVFDKQGWHFLCLAVLLGITNYITNIFPEIFEGELFKVSSQNWFYIAILTPIIHQIYVWLCWRFELVHQSLTKQFKSNAFVTYKIGFFILFIGRFVTLIFLAIANKDTIKMNIYGKYLLIILLSFLFLYAMYSVKKYFGFDRAAGLDHFNKSIAKLEFVKKGIFKYTNNGMYLYAFLGMYLPGVIFQSKAAILVALFSHAYIWVHYYFTELPDMKFIYGKSPK